MSQNSPQSPLALWTEKLLAYQREEAITADPAQKFQLAKLIEECRHKIQTLEKEFAKISVEYPKSLDSQISPLHPTKIYGNALESVGSNIVGGENIENNQFIGTQNIYNCNSPSLLLELQKSLPTNMPQEFLLTDNERTRLKQEFVCASKGLLNWPRTLKNKPPIERKELPELLVYIEGEEHSTTIVLGSPGLGKSSLLATLGQVLIERDYILLAIKADYLSNKIENIKDLQNDDQLRLSLNPIDAVKALANKEKVILLIDQLDAVCELVDRNPERLNVLLTLIQSLANTKNVHIVTTCREFEYRHGSQFSRLEGKGFEKLNLSLPTWELIAPLLEGYQPNNMAESLRELLQNPLHLKLFLEIAKPGDIFDSSQKLLDRLWDERILRKFPQPQEAIDFLEKLAERMKEDEILWLPSSIADSHFEICQNLEKAGILMRNLENSTLGFSHQTYYDHTLARAFARGSQSLTQLVLERQDSLFVRPVLLRSLNYLRGTAPKRYEQELKNLFESSIRNHINSLLIEFIGSQPKPLSIEKQLLIDRLNLENDGIKILDAVTGSPGWFSYLCQRQKILQWLEKTPEEAIYCRPFLYSAAQFDPEKVWHLLEEYWLDNSDYDALSLWIIRDIKAWTSERVRLTKKIIQRSNTDWHNVKHIAEQIAEEFSDLAPGIILAHLNWRLEQAKEKTKKSILHLSDVSSYNRLELNPFKDLLESEADFDELETSAQAFPEAFLKTIWPWFIALLQNLTAREYFLIIRYRDSDLSSDRGNIIKALKEAITELARRDIIEFINFVDQNVNSDLLLTHRLLAQGLEKLASKEPKKLLNYLTSDPRRLSLGDGVNSYHQESKHLIKAICPYLSLQERKFLEEAVYQLDYYIISDELLPEYRLKYLKYNREHRLELLLAFPHDYLSKEGKKLRDEELRAFPWVLKRNSQTNSLTMATFVGPRMTVEEMGLASDEHLLNLFDELSDTTDEFVVRRNKFIDWERSGGVGPQSFEFAKLVKNNPERFLQILPKLQPQRHEHYVGRSICELAETDFSSQTLTDIIENLNQQGFTSDEFRSNVASALEKIAKKSEGLSPSLLSLLLDWLSTHPQPKLENYRNQKQDHSLYKTIIFNSNHTHNLIDGRAAIVRAITAGYLRKNLPDLVNWASFIQSQIGVEKHPSVWIDIVTSMPILLNGDSLQATELFDSVIRNCPEILSSEWALYFIARAIGWFEPQETVQKWLQMLLSENTNFHHQAYGELIFVNYFQYQDEWSKAQIQHHLTRRGNEAILCGLAHAACHLWSHKRCRKLAKEILCSVAICNYPSIEKIIGQFFRRNKDHFYLNQEMRELIKVFCGNPKMLAQAAYDLVEIIEAENLVDTNPDLIVEICQNLLKQAQLESSNSSLAHIADSLTTLAIQLHRQSDYKEIGLKMFEDLLSLNLMETKAALETLDRKPNCLNSSVTPRRKFRRRKTLAPS